MVTLSSLAELIALFKDVNDEFERRLHDYLTKFTKDVVAGAKAQLGHYQGAVGPFPAWQELAETTKHIRVTLGFTPNDPLARTWDMYTATSGTLRQKGPGSYQMIVGSTSDYAWRQEMGDGRIPARPWLGPALFKRAEKVEEDLCQVIYDSFAAVFH
jgi:hypothetical protein